MLPRKPKKSEPLLVQKKHLKLPQDETLERLDNAKRRRTRLLARKNPFVK